MGEADSLRQYLELLSDNITCPIYFVLGNHDYSRGSTEYVRSELCKIIRMRPKLKWLNVCDPISLFPTTALIGHDSWADGRFGEYWRSQVRLNDFLLIGDFIGRTKKECHDHMMRLADEAAVHFQRMLPLALENHNTVIVVTHVPPFAESALYRGKICEPDWLPFFSCKAVGDVLRSIMAAHPEKRALVLCGHTHGSADFQALPNLRVVTGGAVYGRPTVHKAIEVE
jgi:Icc protein